MPKYLVIASYTNDGIKGVLKTGGTARTKAVKDAVEGLGGSLESFYFAFGKDDAYVTIDMPDDTSAAALALAIRARTPYVALLSGDGLWRGLPVVLRGAWIGAFVMPMAGFVREVATSMITLTFRGLFRWMAIFALASWMAINSGNL